MYYADHSPPHFHFHAIYGEHEAVVEIATATTLKGGLPRRATNLVQEWAAACQGELTGVTAGTVRRMMLGPADLSGSSNMIRGVHTMFYTSDAAATRAFLRDKLGFPYTDVGDGWLIFEMPEADMGCHPSDPSGQQGHATPPAGTHAISFYCDDIERTVMQLKARGVEFTRPIIDAGFGLITAFKMPGGVEVDLYEPRYRKDSTPAARA